MTLAWLLPIGFTALAAWLLPLLVHLARRSEHRITAFAALRWLSPKPHPRRRVRFDEIPLLLVRLLLLAAIATLLAMPALLGAPDTRPWVVAAPSLGAAALREAAAAGSEADVQAHWLLPGFPALREGERAAPAPQAGTPRASLSSLLRELDATLPRGAPLTVLVPPTLDAVDAGRIVLSRPVDWTIVDATAADAPTAGRPPSTPPAPVMVRHDPSRAPALRYLRAAQRAWAVDAAAPEPSDAAADATPRASTRTAVATPPAVDTLRIATADVPLDPAIRTLIWLSPGPLPVEVNSWVSAGGHALVDAETVLPAMPALAFDTADWRDADGVALVRSAPLGRGRISQWTRPLSPAEMPQLLDAAFPTQLHALLDDALVPPARVDARAHAPVTGATPFPERPRPLDGWLIAAIALLFALERWMASGARRGRAAE